MTWADDDKQYVSLCDGSGFPGLPRKHYNSRAYAMNGDPPEVTFEYLPGYPDLINKRDTPDGSLPTPDKLSPFRSRYYNFGILALDGGIYQLLSTPNHPVHGPEPRFVGAKLIYSPDNGKSWRNQDGSAPVRWEPWNERSRDNMFFFYEPGDAFSILTVPQMGGIEEHNKDGFVYIYAPNGYTEGTMNQLAMCRVPKDRILDRGAYEFFAARQSDGGAQWISDDGKSFWLVWTDFQDVDGEKTYYAFNVQKVEVSVD